MQEMKRLKKSVFVWVGKKQMFYFTADLKRRLF